MHVIALDPGITTGVAELIGTFEKNVVTTTETKFNHTKFYNWLWELNPQEIVYERFVYQRRNKVELYPVEVIGVIKLFAQEHDKPLYEQGASQAKGLITDDKIKKMDLWVPGEKHGMDALRHLLYHRIVTKGDKTWLDKLNPAS